MAGYAFGYTVWSLNDEERNRPIQVDVWQPAGVTARGAQAASGTVPVIVLSHGAFGAARNYSWLAEHLAGEGFIVLGVSHYGESFIYGPQSIDPQSVLDVWQRARDCSFVLDHLFERSSLKDIADPARVAALGHSSGGATALQLVGAVYDPASMQLYCRDAPADRGCLYGEGAAGSPARGAPRPTRDPRITAAVALDPALGPGHTEESLSGISVPTYIVGAVDNDFLPYASHAGRYARLIPGSWHTQLARGEGHFVFLNECNSDTKANGVPLCRDRDTVERSRVHEELRESIARFLHAAQRAA
jgi:predicted dienelactone hydrolase